MCTLVDVVDDAVSAVRRGGEAFGLNEAPGGGVEADEVGEGASDIDGDDEHAWRLQRIASQGLRRVRDTHRISTLCGIAASRRPWAGARKSAIVGKGKHFGETVVVSVCFIVSQDTPCRSSPRKRGPRSRPWIPAISAFTRVFNALCAGMSGVLLRGRSRLK